MPLTKTKVYIFCHTEYKTDMSFLVWLFDIFFSESLVFFRRQFFDDSYLFVDSYQSRYTPFFENFT